jgi:hypothetical protein
MAPGCPLRPNILLLKVFLNFGVALPHMEPPKQCLPLGLQGSPSFAVTEAQYLFPLKPKVKHKGT